MAFYLGIDGGGSKTTCALGDEVSQLATITTGPSNITRVGEVRARESLHQAVREACSVAKISPEQVKSACIGAAGAGREEVAGTVRKILAEMVPGEIEVIGDMEIALEAAFGNGPGVIVIAGTGSIAYGRDAQGRTARAGGWGFAISDEGSAHWIGRTAVSSLLRAIDQEIGNKRGVQAAADASPLFRELKTIWKLNSLGEILRNANGSPDFALLLPAVLAADAAGDAVAQRVLEAAGAELARLAGIVGLRLFASASLPKVPLALAGGVFRYGVRTREVFCNEVRKLDVRFEVSPEVVDPVFGALRIARRKG